MAYAFAPVHKTAMALAVGLTSGAVIAMVTLLQLLIEDGQGLPLGLLGQYLYGYTESVPGAAIGFAWGLAYGFAAGWFLALVKNLFTALWAFQVRAKADFTQPFLDHL